MQTRELPSTAPDGSTVSFLQELRADGTWYNRSARTPDTTLKMPPPDKTARSGSSNDHSRLAPSASARWTVCTAAPKFEKDNEERLFLDAAVGVVNLIPYLKKIPKAELTEYEVAAVRLAPLLLEDPTLAKRLDDREKRAIWKSNSSEYAREGTRAHDFAARILLGQMKPEEMPEEFRLPVMTYVDHCRGLMAMEGITIIEKEMPLFYSPDDTGTCDFAKVTEGVVYVRDLKYGQGVLECSVENTQLAIYALSFIEDLISDGLYDDNPETLVNMKIVQPRHHEAEADEAWEITLKELRDFCADIQLKADQVKKGKDLKFVPSEKGCKWCPCKAFCEARITSAASVFDGPDGPGIDVLSRFEDLTKEEAKEPVEDRIVRQALRSGFAETEAGVLHDGILVALLKARDGIEKFLSDVHEYMDARVQAGEQIDGLKLVEGRQGNRMWADGAVGGAADKWLQNYLTADKRYEKSLISVAQAEKVMNLKGESKVVQKNFEAKVTRSGPKKVLALDGDKRQAVMAAAERFDDLDAEYADLDAEYADALGADTGWEVDPDEI